MPNIPNYLQAIDLGLGFEILHFRPMVTIRVMVRPIAFRLYVSNEHILLTAPEA